MPDNPSLFIPLVQATLYAAMQMAVARELFPGESYFRLSEDQRRIVNMEAKGMLLRARWILEEAGFASFFLEPPHAPPGASHPPQGQYL